MSRSGLVTGPGPPTLSNYFNEHFCVRRRSCRDARIAGTASSDTAGQRAWRAPTGWFPRHSDRLLAQRPCWRLCRSQRGGERRASGSGCPRRLRRLRRPMPVRSTGKYVVFTRCLRDHSGNLTAKGPGDAGSETARSFDGHLLPGRARAESHWHASASATPQWQESDGVLGDDSRGVVARLDRRGAHPRRRIQRSDSPMSMSASWRFPARAARCAPARRRCARPVARRNGGALVGPVAGWPEPERAAGGTASTWSRPAVHGTARSEPASASPSRR